MCEPAQRLLVNWSVSYKLALYQGMTSVMPKCYKKTLGFSPCGKFS
jgi:hypothetical protein